MLAFVVVAVILSNFMSNTAAANVLVPLAIALDTGFTSPQHMATVFRRLVGQTPSAWRSERT